MEEITIPSPFFFWRGKVLRFAFRTPPVRQAHYIPNPFCIFHFDKKSSYISQAGLELAPQARQTLNVLSPCLCRLALQGLALSVFLQVWPLATHYSFPGEQKSRMMDSMDPRGAESISRRSKNLYPSPPSNEVTITIT